MLAIPRLSIRVLLAALLPVATAPAAEAQLPVPPNLRWQTIESPHVRVTFAPGLESVAHRAATAAEQSWLLLEGLVGPPPHGKVDLVLGDHVDYSRGVAFPFPSNRIWISARPSADALDTNYSDWTDWVVSHEMTHVFHGDRAGRFGMALRGIFGRVPLPWLVFPVGLTPAWSIEGLAVNVESAFTGLGRVHGSLHDMVLRTATLEGRFERMDRLNESSPIWPGGNRAYIYGSLFMHWLEERYGEQVHRTLVDRTASAGLPPFLFFDQVARRAVGRTFDELYAEWRSDLEDRYGRLADSLRAQGITRSEPVVRQGRLALFPRVSPNGGRLAYASEDGRNVPATRIFDLNAGRVVESTRSNELSASSWLPGGRSLIRSQLEFDGPYRIYSDLDVIGNGARRVTDQARLEHADVARDGERVVAVENGGGTNRLVLLRLSSGVIEPITEFDERTQWAFPRWSPDGARIAASRFRRGGEYDVVVIDAAGRELARLTQDAALDAAPAWSPDGRYIVFSSDRSGIPNLYAADVSDLGAPVLRQVTNVLTGAGYPDVSPDAHWIYFSAYHADGGSIERIPFAPETWRDPSPVRLTARPACAPNIGSPALSEPRPYSPIRSLLPKFWLPMMARRENAGTFVGILTGGTDVVGAHLYGGSAAIDLEGSGRWQGSLFYRWAGLGNPVLDLEARRRWDDIGTVQISAVGPADTAAVIDRNDVVSAFVTFLRRRWRNSTVLSLGFERETFHRSIVNADGETHPDARDVLYNVVGRLAFSNTRAPAYAISHEDGILVGAEARSTVESESAAGFPRDYREVKVFAAAYKSLPFRSFAHHVLVLRSSALLRDGDGAVPSGIGGSTGEADPLDPDLGVSRLLTVRGFDRNTLIGTRAWTATLEYRAPLALVGRRPALSPIFIDRVAAAAFADFGDAQCTGRAERIYQGCGRREAFPTPLASAGAELILHAGFAGIVHDEFRFGAAVPLRGPAGSAKFYVLLGSNF